MFWVILLFILVLLSIWAESAVGKIVLGGSVVALGAVVLNWIMDVPLLENLAEICLIGIVVTIVLWLLSAIFGA